MLKAQTHSSLSPGSSWDSAITITSSPSSVSNCDGIGDAEWNSFSDSGEFPSRSSHEKLDIDSAFRLPPPGSRWLLGGRNRFEALGWFGES
ncbi:hypothetical protein E5D57_004415 [Metarhizium anisopliae]|nr:hypothetical protein E5D57_004415 [Metarhizium anisopliae]